MSSRAGRSQRTTKETDISVQLEFGDSGHSSISTGLPFLDHVLTSCAFHGRMRLEIVATGDLDVDPHHVVEDVGLVIGDCLVQLSTGQQIQRFGHSVVPMDDALVEVALDAGGRPYLDYRADYPQPRAGAFDVSLVREFLYALTTRARINLHVDVRRGLNSHHMVEALFKAFGRAVCTAYQLAPDGPGMSTKGTI